jgi:hypothetical protein
MQTSRFTLGGEVITSSEFLQKMEDHELRKNTNSRKKHKSEKVKPNDEFEANLEDLLEESVLVEVSQDYEAVEEKSEENKEKFKKEKRNCKPSEKKKDWEKLKLTLSDFDEENEDDFQNMKKKKRKREKDDLDEWEE